MKRFLIPYLQARGATPVSRDFDEVLGRVAFENAGGDTALIDTIYASLQSYALVPHSRKALLIISDGMDNHSRYSRRELLDRAMESDAQIYTVAVTALRRSTPSQSCGWKKGEGFYFSTRLAARPARLSFVASVAGGTALQRRPPVLARRCAVNTPSDMCLAGMAVAASGVGSRSR